MVLSVHINKAVTVITETEVCTFTHRAFYNSALLNQALKLKITISAKSTSSRRYTNAMKKIKKAGFDTGRTEEAGLFKFKTVANKSLNK